MAMVSPISSTTLWMPLVPVKKESALAYVPGSHRSNQVFDQYNFGDLNPEQVRELVRKQHMKQIKTIIQSLKAQPEGDGNMFDNTMIMYFPEAGDGHHGKGWKPPMFVMSGKNCNLDIAGRYFRFPHHGTEGHMTLGNWYTTLLNAHGNPIKHYGDLDSTMNRKGIPQEGPIKSFMKKG